MHTMKTAISLDDHLLKQADETARRMGLSRSGLFALALQDYLRRRRQQEVAEQLNQVYTGKADLPEQRTTARMKAKFRSTIKDRW
jgi:metal-responsive CopG/Arc/MetJ family transcriptional regulator